ncbi:MAG: hypothetical protein Q8Q14_05985 [Gemmatimonadales bacterium]|nr:hypothetical protein [Gemmatimonadales bacterium]
MKAILIGGTHSFGREDWHDENSPFARDVLAPAGIEVVAPDGRPYLWSGALDGVIGSNTKWESAGYHLLAYAVPPLAPEHRIPSAELIVIAHSHAGQAAAYAFAYGLKGTLVTIGTPVRKDMQPVWGDAHRNISRHLHLYSKRDWWQLFGAIGDGVLGILRTFPEPTRNDEMPKGHGDVLRDVALFPLWQERGWVAFIRGGTAAAV